MKVSFFHKIINQNNESFSCQRQSFSERNFQGALLLEKETIDE